MKVRCKVRCTEVAKRTGWNNVPFVYNAKFAIVTGDSEENKKFFAATPSGAVEFGTLAADAFEVGKEYYVDLTPA